MPTSFQASPPSLITPYPIPGDASSEFPASTRTSTPAKTAGSSRALVAFYSATGDSRYRDEAVRAARWIVDHRSAPGGGFRHENDSSRLYLGDSLAMGQAFLALYSATSDPAWLTRASQAAAFIRAHFTYLENGQPIGFATSAGDDSGGRLKPRPQFDEDVALARFASLLFHYSNNAADRTMAGTALRYAVAPDVAHSRFAYVGGLLLAQDEYNSDPLHIVIVGRKTDPGTQSLFATALAYPCVYKHLEKYDPGDPSSSSQLQLYPRLPKAAAFVCAHQSCSTPVFDSPQLLALLNRAQTAPASSK